MLWAGPRAALHSCDGCLRRAADAHLACGPLPSHAAHPVLDAHRLQARYFQGGLAQLVTESCVAALKRSGHLPFSHGVVAGALPMQPLRPPCVVMEFCSMGERAGGRRDRKGCFVGGGGGNVIGSYIRP